MEFTSPPGAPKFDMAAEITNGFPDGFLPSQFEPWDIHNPRQRAPKSTGKCASVRFSWFPSDSEPIFAILISRQYVMQYTLPESI